MYKNTCISHVTINCSDKWTACGCSWFLRETKKTMVNLLIFTYKSFLWPSWKKKKNSWKSITCDNKQQWHVNCMWLSLFSQTDQATTYFCMKFVSAWHEMGVKIIISTCLLHKGRKLGYSWVNIITILSLFFSYSHSKHKLRELIWTAWTR